MRRTRQPREGTTGQNRAEHGASPRFRSDLLIRARLELGLTQEDAARAVGVDVRTYRRYESGEVNAPDGFNVQRASRRTIVHRMAKELGLDEAELVSAPALTTPQADGHVLVRAKHFVGRCAELEQLAAWLADPGRGNLFVVVAMGGAGKTSLIEHALARQRTSLIWSFYEDPRVEAFFAALPEAGLVILDGMEVLQSNGEDGRARGELDDSRMRLWLRKVARGNGQRVLATSRFALTDLAAWEGDTLSTLALGPLSRAESSALLERWGTRQGDPLHEASGGHALSVAVLGSFVAEVLDGDASRFDGVDLSELAKDQGLARRLDRVLVEYANSLSALDRDLLCRISTFPRGIDSETAMRLAQLGGVMAGALSGVRQSTIDAALKRLERIGLASSGPSGRYSTHPFIRQHFRALLGGDEAAIHEAERARLEQRLELRPHEPPSSTSALDALEALLVHTVLAGQVEQATELYFVTLGGFRHLGLELGELARGLRIVRAFAEGDAASPARLSRRLPYATCSRLTYEWGLYAAAGGDLRAAARCYEIQNAMSVSGPGDRHALITGLRTLAYTQWLMGRLDEAESNVARSIALAEADGITEALVRGLALEGALLGARGRFDEAMRRFGRARALGDVPVARRSLWEAEVLLGMGEVERARQATSDNLGFAERLGWGSHAAQCRVLLGWVALHDGDLPTARGFLDAAMQWCGASGEVEMTLRALALEAAVVERTGGDPGAIRDRATDLRSGGFAPMPELIRCG